MLTLNPVKKLGVGIGVVTACVGLVRAATDCGATAAQQMGVGHLTQGRQALAQGIALFDSKNLKMAERAFQSALFAGLSDQSDLAAAHKYLAFTYCTNNESSRCEAAFDAAFLAQPSFALADHEVRNTPWHDAYQRAATQWKIRCGRSQDQLIQMHLPETNVPDVATNVSTATAAARSLPDGAVSRAMPAASAVRDTFAAYNLLLRVSPWAMIKVDGKSRGVLPPTVQFNLVSGSHTIEFLNPGFAPVRRVINVVDGKAVTIAYDFDAR